MDEKPLIAAVIVTIAFSIAPAVAETGHDDTDAQENARTQATLDSASLAEIDPEFSDLYFTFVDNSREADCTCRAKAEKSYWFDDECECEANCDLDQKASCECSVEDGDANCKCSCKEDDGDDGPI